MSRIFNQLKKDFSQIPNSLINDRKMTRQARFLFILLGSQADSFEPRQDWILDMMGWSDRTTLAKYWTEVETFGWGYRVRKRKDGRLGKYSYNLFAYPDVERVERSRTSNQLTTSADSINSRKNPQLTESTVDPVHTPYNTNPSNNTNPSKQDEKINKGEANFLGKDQFTVRECLDLLAGDDEVLFRKHIGTLLYQVLKTKKGQMDAYRMQAGVDANELPNIEFEKVCHAWSQNADNKASALAGYADNANRLGMYTINYLKGRRFVKGAKPKQKEQGLPQGFVSPLAGRSKPVDPRAAALMNRAGSKFKK